MQLGKAVKDKDVVQGGGASLADIAQVLDDSRAYLDGLKQFLLMTSNLFRVGNETQAKESFVELVKGLDWVIVSADAVTRALELDFAVVQYENRPLTDTVKDLNTTLLDMVNAQERRDWVLLSDLLEYELEPQLQKWHGFFTALRSQL